VEKTEVGEITMEILIKIIVTAVIVLSVLILQRVLKNAIEKFGSKKKVTPARVHAVHRAKSSLLYFAGIVLLILTWGFSIQNIWVTITGFIGLVAIGFFAVWSVLSNIFAGFILFFSRILQIGRKIEILPEGISGTVEEVNFFFIVLKDESQNEILIPNNMIFQKTIKRIMQ
jgi:small-conductance mechanosensitive channel